MTTLTAIGAPEDDGERPTALPVPYYDPDDLNQRFVHEPVVMKRCERGYLAPIVKELVAEYGAPYDLSVGPLDPMDQFITVLSIDWRRRSLYDCLNDLTNKTGLWWAIDEQHRLCFRHSRVHYVEAVRVHVTWNTTGYTVNPTVWRLQS